MPQVVPVDGQDFVVVAQLAVLGGEASWEQVQDEDARLVRLADELDAQRLGALALHQHHLGDGALAVVRVGGVVVVMVVVVGGLWRRVGGRGGRRGGWVGGGAGAAGGGGGRMLLGPSLEALLLHDGDAQQRARPPQHPDGPVVAHRRQAHVIHLQHRPRAKAGSQTQLDISHVNIWMPLTLFI